MAGCAFTLRRQKCCATHVSVTVVGLLGGLLCADGIDLGKPGGANNINIEAVGAAQHSKEEPKVPLNGIQKSHQQTLFGSSSRLVRRDAAADEGTSLALIETSEDGDNVGNDKCPCIDIGMVKPTVTIGNDTLEYGDPDGEQISLGSKCKAWDDGQYPGSCENDLQTPGKGKDWCAKSWCYVNPCKCTIAVEPKLSSYLPDKTFEGHKIYYSYATCGSEDSWTAENSEVACVNLKTKTECTNKDTCAWVEDKEKCLGKDLANECADSADGNSTNSSASRKSFACSALSAAVALGMSAS
eukprot:TRINITY_DN66676_c0_g1_i1.p1 TRINITY_DN66676_c0_g1~~TRINITY_DN66676_c0_g1_i1.p1  ORF type:complete len:298 (+),score=41.33 TRINITY_DN66676_c0_g1_i1:77-970(+)